jgi:hypothetical protein
MALKQCKECDNTVSNQADRCPHCGAPIKPVGAIPEKQKKWYERSSTGSTPSLAWGIPGIVLQSAGVEQPALLLLGTVMLIIGFCYYAKAKGRSSAWYLMGFLSIIGLIILGCLKDIEKESTQKQAITSIEQSQGNYLAHLEKLGELKEKGILTDEEYCAQKEKLLCS